MRARRMCESAYSLSSSRVEEGSMESAYKSSHFHMMAAAEFAPSAAHVASSDPRSIRFSSQASGSLCLLPLFAFPIRPDNCIRSHRFKRENPPCYDCSLLAPTTRFIVRPLRYNRSERTKSFVDLAGSHPGPRYPRLHRGSTKFFFPAHLACISLSPNIVPPCLVLSRFFLHRHHFGHASSIPLPRWGRGRPFR